MKLSHQILVSGKRVFRPNVIVFIPLETCLGCSRMCYPNTIVKNLPLACDSEISETEGGSLIDPAMQGFFLMKPGSFDYKRVDICFCARFYASLDIFVALLIFTNISS